MFVKCVRIFLIILFCLCFSTLALAMEADLAKGSTLVISEAMNHNEALWELKFQEYVELYNASGDTLQLENYVLTRDDKRCTLPKRELAPGEYALLLCDGQELSFNLSKSGCGLSLETLDGQKLDTVSIPEMMDTCAWTREYGANTQPSPGFANDEAGRKAYWQSLPHTLIISEVVSSNVSLNKRDDEFYDLIELYNAGSAPVTLSDFYLSDEAASLKLWQMGEVEMDPGECYTVYASGNGGREASFKVGSDGETIYLSDANGHCIDAVSVPMLKGNQSYGRFEGQLYYYEEGNVGKQNKAGKTGVCAKPTISVQAGVYTAPVSVTLSGEGEIHYTLDGKPPTIYSPVYTGDPLVIEKTACLRAASMCEDMITSDIATQTYLMDAQQYQLPFLTVSGDPQLILGQSGIYQNYLRRQQEVPINLTLIEDGKIAFSIDCGLKLHGNGSRKLPKKSFQVRFRSRYGAETLTYPLFSDTQVTTYHSLILRSGSEDSSRSLFRDEFLTSLAGDAMPQVLYQSYKPVNLFINGEYFGIYFMRERTDRTYVTQYLGGSEDDVDMVEGWSIQEYGDISDWNALMSFCRRNDLSKDENYQHVASQISIEGFIDYYIIRAYTGDRDYCNIRHCRSRGGDGLWRIINYDLDWGFSNAKSPFYIMLGSKKDTAALNNVMMRALLKNANFMDLFLTRLNMHLRTTFETQRVLDLLEKTRASLGEDLERNQKRWSYSMKTFEKRYGLLRTFVSEKNGEPTRVNKLMADAKYTFKLTDEQMVKYFGDLWLPEDK